MIGRFLLSLLSFYSFLFSDTLYTFNSVDLSGVVYSVNGVTYTGGTLQCAQNTSPNTAYSDDTFIRITVLHPLCDKEPSGEYDGTLYARSEFSNFTPASPPEGYEAVGNDLLKKCNDNEVRGDDGECYPLYDNDPIEVQNTSSCSQLAQEAMDMCSQVGLVVADNSFNCKEENGVYVGGGTSYECVPAASDGTAVDDNIEFASVSLSEPNFQDEVKEDISQNPDDTTDIDDLYNNLNTNNKNLSNKINQTNQQLSNLNENIIKQLTANRKQISNQTSSITGSLDDLKNSNSDGLDDVEKAVTNNTNVLNTQLQNLNDFVSSPMPSTSYSVDSSLSFDEASFESEIQSKLDSLLSPFTDRVKGFIESEKERYFSQNYVGSSCAEIAEVRIDLDGQSYVIFSQALIDQYNILPQIRAVILMLFALSGILVSLRGGD